METNTEDKKCISQLYSPKDKSNPLDLCDTIFGWTF